VFADARSGYATLSQEKRESGMSEITSTPPLYSGPEPDKDAKTMAMLCHLLSIFTGFLGPLLIWLLKKDSHPFIDDQGKEALNFQLTVLIGYFIGGATAYFCVGIFIILAVWIFHGILAVMGAMKANEGIAYRYPINLRLIK
jgi:hypothetical protein